MQMETNTSIFVEVGDRLILGHANEKVEEAIISAVKEEHLLEHHPFKKMSWPI